ncbi:hypothetical protein Pmar_PMAR006407 [Perkinsus marinus ATCC 50983]|uniref:Uncharacterized protein n=1 Tax=Perkinsus marinus (strain ATCC 50983 / TXsc) TaxID=423536 RepID=C5K9L5_PERM5|nr:hypothetical protein Pmar_PMAR006407 [Perkinsus marinus ATCC 50983]EER18787.1 hypothetical protein Pmar_PMAR006407 [Perkinsus marinus ATCC 50983]|eukprot:XP_002786991.1 hypothetical protein Pmar_PMAR006407 [Perkinsus marinus ATCC 50983]
MVFDINDILYYVVTIALIIWLYRIFSTSPTTTGEVPAKEVAGVDEAVPESSGPVPVATTGAAVHEECAQEQGTDITEKEETTDETPTVESVHLNVAAEAVAEIVAAAVLVNEVTRRSSKEEEKDAMVSPTALLGPAASDTNGPNARRVGGHSNQRQATANEFEIQRSILAAANSRSISSLLLIVEKHLDELNSVNVSTLIHRLASITQNQEQNQRVLANDPRVKEVLRRAIDLAPTSSCQSLSNICWAIGKLQMVEEKDVVRAIVEAAKSQLEELMDLVAEKVANTLYTFKPQEVSNLLYAYGRLNCYNEKLLQEICACVATMMPRYDGQGVGNVICSLAKLKYPCIQLMDAIAADVVMTPYKYGRFLISKVLRPLHSLGYTNLSMLVTASSHVLDNSAADVRIDDIITVMQGFAQESVKAPTASSEGTMLKPSPRSLASTFPDYEGAGRRVGALMQATAMKFSTVAKLEEISLEKIVQLFNLMARLGMKSKPNNGGFLLSACARILQNLDTMNEEQIKSILRSCAAMELALTSFEERLLNEIVDPDDSFIMGAASSTATGSVSCSSPESFVNAPAASESMPVDLISADCVPMLPESVTECGWSPESLEYLFETDAEHLAHYYHHQSRGDVRW